MTTQRKTKREREIEAYLCAQVRINGGIAWKFVSPGKRGVPDRIVVLYGSIVFVEVKSATGTVELSQQARHNELRDAGARVAVVRSENDVDTLLFALAV